MNVRDFAHFVREYLFIHVFKNDKYKIESQVTSPNLTIATRIIKILKRNFVGTMCSLWHSDGSAEIFAIFGFCLITARAGHILVSFVLFVLPLFKLVQQQDCVSWWQRSSAELPILDVPDNVTPEAAEPVALAGAAAAEVAAVRPAPQVSLRHLAGCDGRRPSSCFDSFRDIIECPRLRTLCT